MPPRRIKNTPATLSILSSEVSSAEGLDKSGQDLLGHHLYTINKIIHQKKMYTNSENVMKT